MSTAESAPSFFGPIRSLAAGVERVVSERAGPTRSNPLGLQGRGNIHLRDPSLLRGTTTAVLLERFGRRLRGSVGGLGCVNNEGDAEYAKSFEVAELDVFLSHSWHAFWLSKYILLLLHFNLQPALVASVAVGMFCSLTQERWKAQVTDEGISCWSIDCQCEWLSPSAGLLAFILVLFSWHFISSRWKTSVFLDKVCIHQTDLARKEEGIKAIGAILERSKAMLVAWDASYFSRLWCVYELSAFKFTRRNSRITIRSMQLSFFLGAVCCVGNATYVMIRLYQGYIHRIQAMLIFLFLSPMAPSIFSIRAFARERQDLKRQLKHFSVRQTLCFCCTHNHIHPETGTPLLCDREHVYDSIAGWYGGGNRDVGLDRFDELIRGQLKEDLHRTLGKSWKIPYAYAVLAGLPSFHLSLAWSNRCPWVDSVAAAFELLLCRFPLCVAYTLFICKLIEDECQGKWLDRLAEVSVVLASSSCVLALDYADDKIHDWNGLPSSLLGGRGIYMCWIAGQIVLTLLFYLVLARMNVKDNSRRVRSTAVELVTRVTSMRGSSQQ